VTPDIATYAKLISGGLVPLALTLTTEVSQHTDHKGRRKPAKLTLPSLALQRG